MAKQDKKEITTLEEAKKAMGEINKYDNIIASYYEQEANAVSNIRAQFHTGVTNAKRQAFEALKKNRVKQLEAFAKKNRKDWDGKQSQNTPFGSFGFRKGQPCVVLIKKVCKNFDEALEKVKDIFPDYVRVKEEINKDRLLEEAKLLSKEMLETAGLKIDQKEPFFIKTLAAEKLEEASKKLKSA